MAHTRARMASHPLATDLVGCPAPDTSAPRSCTHLACSAEHVCVFVEYAPGTSFDAFPAYWSPVPVAAAAIGLADALASKELWSSTAPSSNGPRLVPVSEASEEFGVVSELFLAGAHPALRSTDAHQRTMRRWRRVPVRVSRVERVENAALLGVYLARRDLVAAQCGDRYDPLRMEQWLFHGPGNLRDPDDEDQLTSILREGFLPLLAGSRNGAAFGLGAMSHTPHSPRSCPRLCTH